MDVVKAVETYITKMISVPSAMKVLLLDSHTVRTSRCFTTGACVDPSLADTHNIPGRYAVRASLTPGVPHRSHRQQQARTHGPHEVHMLSAE